MATVEIDPEELIFLALRFVCVLLSQLSHRMQFSPDF